MTETSLKITHRSMVFRKDPEFLTQVRYFGVDGWISGLLVKQRSTLRYIYEYTTIFIIFLYMGVLYG
jgi:hypothetical protein